MSEVNADGNVQPVTDNVTQQVHVTDADLPNNAPDTAESLGIDAASYDKYYRDGNMDWASYGKEVAFKQQQAADKAIQNNEPAPAEEAGDAQGVVENAGLSWEDLGAKISSVGDIDAEDRAALHAIGIPDQVINDYIGAVTGEAQGIIDAVIDGMGGQEAFDAVYAGLHANSTETQRNNIDALLRDPATRQAGIDTAIRLSGVQVQQGEQPQATPVASRGNTTAAAPAAQGFSSFEEQMAAQRDPRYNRDAAFTQEVINRIAVSTYQMNPRSHSGGM
jgi:hypothetical protein